MKGNTSTLVFHARNGAAEIALEKAVEISIINGAISAGGPLLASYTDDGWHVGSQRIERIVCCGRIRIEFDCSGVRKCVGPFDELSLAGELAYTPHGVVARYHPLQKTWFLDRACDSEAGRAVMTALGELAPA